MASHSVTTAINLSDRKIPQILLNELIMDRNNNVIILIMHNSIKYV